MKAECITAVGAMLGRAPSEAELRNIEGRLAKSMRAEAAQDTGAWLALPLDQQVQAGAARAAKDMLDEAALKTQRLHLQITATARLQQQLAAFPGTPMEALAHAIAFHADTKGAQLSIESRAKAIERDALRQMLDTLTATSPKFFALIEDQAGIRDLVRELHGEKTGNSDAANGAKAFRDIAERLRQRFNASGGDVGQLEDWGMPHHHSQLQVARAGQSAWHDSLSPADRAVAKVKNTPPPAEFAKQAWVADILPKLNRSRYVDEFGARMSDEQVRTFLGEAWTTIATGGVNKTEPGKFTGNGARANRGNQARQVHFKDADAYLDYQASYGEHTPYEVMLGHISGVAKDVALVETFGPNPDATFRLLRDAALQAEALANPANTGKAEKAAGNVDNLYALTAGKTLPVASPRVAAFFDGLRNIMVASKLGSAVITAVTDEGTMRVAAHVNNLPEMQLVRNELAALNPANPMEKRLAMRAGLALNTLAQTVNRFGNDMLGSGWSSKIAGATIRASGLNAMTDARRRAFGVTYMSALGQLSRDAKSLADLDTYDHRILLSKGVTDVDFAVWKAAQLEDWGDGNNTMLTPDAIYRVPDSALDAALAPEFAKIRAEADTQIADLDGRNRQENEWLAKREQSFADAQPEAAAEVERLRAAKGAKANAAIEELQARAELLQVNAELVAAQRGLTLAEAGEPSTDRVRGLVADAAATKGAGGDVAGLIERRADSVAGQAVGRGYSAGKQAGERIGNIKRRIVELEAKARQVERAAGRDVDDAARKINRKLDGMTKELEQFAERATERVRKRQAVMARLDRDVATAMAQARIRARDDAATRLLGTVLEETDVAIIEPGVKERALMFSHLQRGTLKGELTRSLFLFKSFPIAMMTRHWSRALAQPTGTGKAAYLAALAASTTMLGMVALQTSQIVQGKDPRDMTEFKTWVQALLKGGALSLFGDFLLADQTEHGGSVLATAAGPIFGTAEDAIALTVGNLHQAARGEDTHAGAEALRFAKGNTPGANLWYTRAAVDHLILHQLQEYLSPGYLRKMKRRSEKEFGQSFWWEPGEAAPERAPDLAAAVEGE